MARPQRGDMAAGQRAKFDEWLASEQGKKLRQLATNQPAVIDWFWTVWQAAKATDEWDFFWLGREYGTIMNDPDARAKFMRGEPITIQRDMSEGHGRRQWHEAFLNIV